MVADNSAFSGGDNVSSGILTLTNVTLSGNSAYSACCDGGGIRNEAALTLIVR